MNDAELGALVLASLSEVAPEIDVDEVEADVDLREQLDIDSMDLLNFMIAIHDRTGVDIPEADYPKLGSVAACVAYLGSRLRDGQGA